MKIDTSNIVESSNIMFQILNSSQQEIVDQNDKIAEINTKEKIKSNKNAILGNVLDMYA